MTVEEIKAFKDKLSKNEDRALVANCGWNFQLAEKLAYAVTIAEYAMKGKTTKDESDKPIYDGIVHLEQLNHSLSTTIKILHDLGCDSLSDITGYRPEEDNMHILFRVKGRLARASLGTQLHDIDLINYVRFFMGLSPIVNEDSP